MRRQARSLVKLCGGAVDFVFRTAQVGGSVGSLWMLVHEEAEMVAKKALKIEI